MGYAINIRPACEARISDAPAEAGTGRGFVVGIALGVGAGAAFENLTGPAPDTIIATVIPSGIEAMRARLGLVWEGDEVIVSLGRGGMQLLAELIEGCRPERGPLDISVLCRPSAVHRIENSGMLSPLQTLAGPANLTVIVADTGEARSGLSPAATQSLFAGLGDLASEATRFQ